MKPVVQKSIDSLPKTVVAHIQHLERIRQDFVANVSHELRTPLTVIHGYLEILLEQKSAPNLHHIFLQMQQQTSRMENLVENLLLLSHLENEAENNITKQHPVPVANLLTHVCAEAQQLSGQARHKIKLFADATLLLQGVDSELQSLFSNIIFNAVKYTPAKKQIEIRWYEENNKAHFVVEDQGIGIAKKHLPRITERFYRVDKARTRASGGTGLGLAIAKHVLLRHHGKLKIQSQLNKGSIFHCTFPKTCVVKLP
jgi:two-component system phosphate regulon sensor histidine kinase PhoR